MRLLQLPLPPDFLRNFNPRTPCGVRPCQPGAYCRQDDFNPRTPCGVRPLLPVLITPGTPISIHAPLAGCDALYSPAGCAATADFNPRTPCGVRPDQGGIPRADAHFNPRTPCGVRRSRYRWLHPNREISIHAPLAGCDAARQPECKEERFQSTHPLRGATRWGWRY